MSTANLYHCSTCSIFCLFFIGILVLVIALSSMQGNVPGTKKVLNKISSMDGLIDDWISQFRITCHLNSGSSRGESWSFVSSHLFPEPRRLCGTSRFSTKRVSRGSIGNGDRGVALSSEGCMVVFPIARESGALMLSYGIWRKRIFWDSYRRMSDFYLGRVRSLGFQSPIFLEAALEKGQLGIHES